MPRSGTTILYEAFARHPLLAWPSNYSQSYPTLPWLNLSRRLLDNRWLRLYGTKKQYQKQNILSPYLPRPNEAYRFWDRQTGVDFSRDWLLDTDCDPAVAQRLRNSVTGLCRWQGRPRFSAKLTGPPRIRFLQSAFGPQTVFVHVIRDPRAVVESLMNIGFWRELGGFDGPFWKGGLAQDVVDQWARDGRDPAVLAALQWRQVIQAARAESAGLDPSRYIEVRYEAFMQSPHEVLTDLYRACRLDDAAAAHRALERGPTLRNMNDKFRQKFSPGQIARLNAAAEPALSELGYS
jgi:hypothetical protein